ncbi:MAG: trigger factor [Candidatus Gracilibacteria bacterium]|nr:trigger factor [Candidatus Gracilibacteria bacterium]
MKITRNNLEKSIVELIVEESVENVAKARSKAIEYLQKNGEVKGFRKGAKIPADVVVRQYGEDHINRIAIDFSIDAMYKEALKSEKLIPVAQGEIKEIVSENPLTIKIHIEVLPNVEISKDYKKISLKKTKLSVSDDEVTNALSDIEKRFTKFEDIADESYKAQLGDRVSIDTDGFENGKLLENTSMKNYPLVLGSNLLVPGFEEKIVGAKTSEELELPIVFPKDYHNSDFAGKETTFKVKVNKIEKAVKPEFTPEFVEQLRGKKLDLEGFKALIKEEILETKDANARIDEESKLIDELLKITTLDIGNAILANQIEKVFAEIKENMANDQVKMLDYLESLKLDEETYKENHVKPVALKRLQGELILHKLGELEKIEISDDEMKVEIEKVLAKFQNPEVLEKLKNLYLPNTKYYSELKQRMIYRKLIDSFFN